MSYLTAAGAGQKLLSQMSIEDLKELIGTPPNLTPDPRTLGSILKSVGVPPGVLKDEWSESSRLKAQISSRLRTHNLEKDLGVEHFTAFKSGETVYLFVVSEGQATILKDEYDLFPSDTLITQLRLLRKVTT